MLAVRVGLAFAFALWRAASLEASGRRSDATTAGRPTPPRAGDWKCLRAGRGAHATRRTLPGSSRWWWLCPFSVLLEEGRCPDAGAAQREGGGRCAAPVFEDSVVLLQVLLGGRRLAIRTLVLARTLLGRGEEYQRHAAVGAPSACYCQKCNDFGRTTSEQRADGFPTAADH